MALIPLRISDVAVNQNNKDDLNKLLNRNYGKGRYTVYNPLFTPYQITFFLDDFTTCIIRQLKYQWNSGNTTDQKWYIVRKDNGQKVLIHSFTQGQYGTPPVEFTPTIDPSLQVDASKLIFESASAAGDFPDFFEPWGDYTLKTWPAVTINRVNATDIDGAVVAPWDVANHYYPEKIPNIASVNIKKLRLYNGYPQNHDGSGNLVINGGWQTPGNAQLLKTTYGITTQMCYLDYPYYPWATGSTRNQPGTYAALAADIYQFVLHAKNNGNYLEAIEPGNELNRWYGGNPAVEWMDGFAHAALCSMCYDGHKGQYPNTGAKTADPNILVILPGLATIDLDIWWQMKEWTIANRGYLPNGEINWPFDVYSYHSYSSLAGQRTGNPGGIPPEYGMRQAMQNVNNFRKRFAKNIKIRIGEGGSWDINSGSPLNAPAFSGYTAQQTSAMWTARALMVMLENENEYFTYYRIAQDWPNSVYDNSGEIFNTMALVRQESDGVQQGNGTWTGLGMHRTLTGDYVRQLMALMNGGYKFVSLLSETPFVMKFSNGTSDIYAIWHPENMTIPADQNARPTFTKVTGGFTINTPGTIKRFTEDFSGAMTSQAFSGGSIAYDSRPVFLVTGAGSPPPVDPPGFEPNVMANTPTVVVARTTISFQAAGLDVTNTRIVYEVGTPIRSWAPDRQVNAISGFEAEKGYYLISKVDMDLRSILIPPIDPGPLL